VIAQVAIDVVGQGIDGVVPIVWPRLERLAHDRRKVAAQRALRKRI
jgi:hypothetical protein